MRVLVAAIAVGASALRAQSTAPQTRKDGHALKPVAASTDQYEKREVEGWTVWVNRRLLTDKAELGRRALRLLETKLYEVGRVVPEPGCRELRKVPVWLGVDDGHAPCAEYHPSREWLRRNGYNPDKAKCVEIGCADKFLKWSRHQPMMVLHELAHAYHHQVVGHKHPGWRAAYDAAVAGGKYEAVLCHDGRTKRAYAMSNIQEYFAELTECFFGTNDFYPFVRAELQEHDPEAFRLLQKLWSHRQDPREISPRRTPRTRRSGDRKAEQ